MVVILIVFLFVALIVIGPLLTISALNTLFHIGIPLTLGTWAATLWLCLIIGGRSYNRNK